MELSAQNPEINPRLERQNTYNQFLIDLLDRRHTIERSIQNQEDYRGEYNYDGLHIDSFAPPSFLDSYIQPFNPLTIDIQATRDEDGLTSFNHVALYPEDDTPVSIEYDGDFTVLKQSGEVISILESDSIETTLRQLLPAQVRELATPNQILSYIGESSPAITSTIERDIQTETNTGTVTFSKIETVDDSIETLTVLSSPSHPSPYDVYFRMTLTESVNRRQQTRNSNEVSRNLTVEVMQPSEDDQSDWNIEELINSELQSNAMIPVDIATRQHIDHISSILAALDR